MKYLRQKLWLILIVTAFLAAVTGEKVFAMKITVVTTTGKTLSVDAEPEDTIEELKDFVFDVTQIHRGTQRMYKDSIQLENEQTLASYNISEGDTIYVKLGAGTSAQEEKKLGGFVKTLILIIVLFGIVMIARKVLSTKNIEEEQEDKEGEQIDQE